MLCPTLFTYQLRDDSNKAIQCMIASQKLQQQNDNHTIEHSVKGDQTWANEISKLTSAVGDEMGGCTSTLKLPEAQTPPCQCKHISSTSKQHAPRKTNQGTTCQKISHPHTLLKIHPVAAPDSSPTPRSHGFFAPPIDTAACLASRAHNSDSGRLSPNAWKHFNSDDVKTSVRSTTLGAVVHSRGCAENPNRNWVPPTLQPTVTQQLLRK